MTGKYLMAAALVAGGVLAAPPTWAQSTMPPDRSTDIPEEQSTRPGASPGAQALDVDNLSTRELRDKAVYDKSNEKIATVRDVTGTPGHTRQAILRTGGVMGVGGKDVAVPLDSLSVGADGKLVLNMTEEQLKLLPKIN